MGVTTIRAGAAAAVAALFAVGAAGGSGAGVGAAGARQQGGLPQGSEPVQLDPSDFTTAIDNPYWPMTRGARWVYRTTSPDGTRRRVVVVVTGRARLIANGITARVVHDTVTEGSTIVEDTFDWYAQDREGNVWYLGELTKEYENGKVVSTAGSWEAGVDGAQPGIIMPAHPTPGLSYRQEYYAGEAEDKAEIFRLDEQVQVPYGHFTDVLMTKDTNALERRALEYTFYAPGIGPVLTLGVSGGDEREELLRVTGKRGEPGRGGRSLPASSR